MGASIEDDDRSDGSYDSDFTGSSGSDSESDTFSPQQAAQVRTPISRGPLIRSLVLVFQSV